MKKIENDNIIERIKSDKELVAEFTSNMQLITKQTGIKLTISTEHNSPARMRPGDTRVFFNPVFTLRAIQAIQLERAKRLGITENFTFDINHLSQLMLHEINHMINHTQLKMSDKIIKIDEKNMNMIEYERYLFEKYGKDFQEFQNIMEDIDVNNHATKIQAPVFEPANQDIYHYITAPFYDFSKDALEEQFAWTILRESMLPKEKCIIDQRVRDCIDYLSEPGEDLEKLRDPALNYDEQLPIIHRLYEEYYLRFKEEDKKIQQEKQEKQQQDTQNGKNQEQQQDAQNGKNQEQQQDTQNGKNQEQQQDAQNGKNQEQQQDTQNGKNQEQQQDAQNGKNQEQQQDAQNGKNQEQQQDAQNGKNQEQQQDTQNGKNQEQQQDTQNGKNQGGLLGRLKRLLEGDKERGNSQDLSDKSNKANEKEDNQLDNQKEEQNPQNGDKQGDTEQKEESNETSLRKPMLLPHIFENLNEDGSNLAEQLEKSLNGDNDDSDNEDETSENEETDSSNEASEKEKENEDEKEDPMSKKIKEALERLILNALLQAEEDKNLSPEERSLEATIQQEWNIDGSDRQQMRNIKNAMKNQEKLKQLIKKIEDSKGNSVYDKITKDIFSKIVQIRKWNKLGERHARPFSEGGQLDTQNLIKGIMDRKAGDDDPRILKQEYREQKEKQKAGGFSITFILDGSFSMKGEKNRQQTLSTLLMLYSLQQLNQDIKLEGGDMEDFLISTQAMMFCGRGNVAVLKDRGKDLSVKDMIEITSALGYCDGWNTNAGDAINLYYEQVSKPFERMSQKQYDERRQKVKDGKFKEIVFVLSDGEFHDNPSDTIKKLRKMGIIVCGIGITDGGAPIIRYFGKKSDNEENNKQGFGIVCENAGNLGNTLNELLVQHLEDPSIIG